MKAFIILGNQLFSPATVETLCSKSDSIIYLREDFELCTYYQFHKHKIIFYLSAMRAYAEELRDAGFKVHYEPLAKSSKPYESHLLAFLKTKKVTKVVHFEIEDKFFEKRISSLLQKQGVEQDIHRSPLFLNSREDFKIYLETHSKPQMRTFYERQRKRLKILVDHQLKPLGGQWSFDAENRKPLPVTLLPPQVPEVQPSKLVNEVQHLCDLHFATHPGASDNFWLPVDRKGAHRWLDRFIEERLEQFGPYEDAIPRHSDFVFHSVLTPFLNVGLLTPQEVVAKVLHAAETLKPPFSSVEGFIRQVIGWREFIHGIYQNFSERQEASNYWEHERQLKSCWYDGTTGIPPLDDAIKKAVRYGYVHHIERLMVVGSLMLLLEVEPRQAHRWFMEMFVDSSDWVMGPNVYGMALFSDGGIFATKPYICGSNYYRKMGGYKAGAWCDGVDGLYWQFIEKHLAYFKKNPRLSMMARTAEKMNPERKKKIFVEADLLRDRLTLTAAENQSAARK